MIRPDDESPAATEPASDADASELPLLDLQQLEELQALDARRGGLLRRLIEIFESQGPDAFEALRTALDAGDATTVCRTGHSLKGGYRSLGATRIAHWAAELERLGRAEILDGADAIVDRLERDFEATRRALDQLIAPTD